MILYIIVLGRDCNLQTSEVYWLNVKRIHVMKSLVVLFDDTLTCTSTCHWTDNNVSVTSSHLRLRWSCWLLGSYDLEFNKEGTTLLYLVLIR